MRAPLLLLLLAAACSPSPPEPAAAPAGAGLGPPDPVAAIRQQHLPNIELTTHEGRRVRFYDDLVKGKVVAINFMFATCRLACPAATENPIESHGDLIDVPFGEYVGFRYSYVPPMITDVLRAAECILLRESR